MKASIQAMLYIDTLVNYMQNSVILVGTSILDRSIIVWQNNKQDLAVLGFLGNQNFLLQSDNTHKLLIQHISPHFLSLYFTLYYP